MLVGPKAPVVFEDVRSTFIDNNHDFYKPNPGKNNKFITITLASEYPTVDGHLSIGVYLNALSSCYETFKRKYRERNPAMTRDLNYHDFDYFCMHTPFSKMVQKSYYHLVLDDILTSKPDCASKRYPPALLLDLSKLPSPLKSEDPKVLKVLQSHMTADWVNKCERTLYLAKNLGNIYTGSLYNGLLSLLSSGMPAEVGGDGLDLRGRRVMLFSYGSGCAASLFMIKVSNDGWAYRKVIEKSMFKKRLESRVKLAPEEFDRWMA
jgi:hydroxymethylglutaryl-CoA synthase